MKKRIISMFLSLVMSFAVFAPAFATHTDGDLDYSGHPAFTNEDHANNFRNYTEEDSTLQIPISRTTGKENSSVVGVVLDYKTGQPIVGAIVQFESSNLSAEVPCDTRGRFKIINLPDGTYDWTVSANGYLDASYVGYSVNACNGTTIFTFYIGTDKVLSRNRGVALGGKSADLPLSLQRSRMQSGITSLSAPPSLNATITVLVNGVVTEVSRLHYLAGVVNAELYSLEYYMGKGMTENQVLTLYAAQGIAANTWIECAINIGSNHGSINACDGICCQCYDPTSTNTLIMSVIGTEVRELSLTEGVKFKVVMYRPTNSTYDYIYGAYSSACYSQGTLTYTLSYQPALLAKPCTDLAYGAPDSSHRWGLCQMGAAQRAKDGDSYEEILTYYYSNCSVVSCPIEV